VTNLLGSYGLADLYQSTRKAQPTQDTAWDSTIRHLQRTGATCDGAR